MKECQVCKTCFSDSVNICPTDGMPTVHTLAGEPLLEGKYQLDCRLGQGGMGIVYKARHAYLKTQLAIKVILPDLVGNDPQLVTRFRQEALAAAAIRHQNVVSVTDYGVIDGTVPFLVMEYVEGESLHDMLAREKKLSPDRALDLMTAICAGVGAAHDQGIVHRDLKPLNIMICSGRPNMSQAVKILDFGLAKIKSGELLGSFVQAQTTGLMGSPYYMAPEQWADEEPDSRSDVYSLGVMLFQMLAGDVPFKAASIPAIMKKHISDPAPSLTSVGITASPELELAILHALQKDKSRRTESVDDLVDELRAAVRPEGRPTESIARPALSSLKITTRPPRSNVFVDSVGIGLTPENGTLLVEGMQSGNHHLRVSHAGFQDWFGDVRCDGQPQEIVAELRAAGSVSSIAIPRPNLDSTTPMAAVSFPHIVASQRLDPEQTVVQTAQQSNYDVSVATVPPPAKKSRLSPILLGIGGLFTLFLIGIIGVGGAYWAGLFGGSGTTGNSANSSPTPGPTPAAAGTYEMIPIPGGTFTMGRNVDPWEYGEHVVQVGSFAMGKTEVTNAQYLEFIKATKHVTPPHWIYFQPIQGTEKRPISFVSRDDAIAYARWFSLQHGGTYRLPTEQEWEYAARNGDAGNQFPWGDDWVDGNAIMGRADGEHADVGSKPQGANKWGVLDLIGNVYEWTSTEYYRYPGSEEKVGERKDSKGHISVRGGSADEDRAVKKVSSTWRAFVPKDTKNKALGFRLVKE
ncbi:MAG TPA: bifunctional serine/threonine-protein kinase/formylglycine-generating enzyme family protein, partial [Pyrinomonadaceae bacterium]|nr:bifunctional serine/threonine-protein kinase/formylglycine-generating enzyme family protein [Pyrinomonadaceae bacterium]